MIRHIFACGCAETSLNAGLCLEETLTYQRKQKEKRKDKKASEEQADGQTVHCLSVIYIYRRLTKIRDFINVTEIYCFSQTARGFLEDCGFPQNILNLINHHVSL